MATSDVALCLNNLSLLTPCRKIDVLDFRWIGHALTRGYAALHWSLNIGAVY